MSNATDDVLEGPAAGDTGSLSHIEPRFVMGMDDAAICALVQLLPEITSLSIRNLCRLPESVSYDVLSLIACWKRLRKLSLTHFSPMVMGGGSPHVIEDPVMEIGPEHRTHKKHVDAFKTMMLTVTQYCKDIEELNLSRCFLTDLMSTALAQNLPKLNSLNFNQCRGVTGYAIGLYASHTPALQHLSLAHVNVGISSLILLASHCRALQEIDLSGCSHVNDMCIKAIATCELPLVSVNLSQCVRVSEVGLIDLIKGSPRLTYLNLDGVRITDITLTTIASTCPHLTSLFISSGALYHTISGYGVQTIAMHCRSLTCLSLRSLQLRPGIFNNFGALVELHLLTCHVCPGNVLNALMPTVRHSQGAPVLRKLTLQSCGLNETCSRNIVEIVKELHVFSMSDPFVGSSRLRSLLKATHNLRSLDLVSENRKFHITDTTVGLLTKTCRHLHTLSVAGCIQPEVVVALLNAVPSIKRLTVRLYTRKREQVMLGVVYALQEFNRPDLLWDVYAGM
eukprot:c9780_g1_i1.p1 GENE.c9780_g1_i1~~c9780_g1_i1.p1  ORF type:complete len:531 (-),score=151.25 c9780_g1_i1:139-1665(-)